MMKIRQRILHITDIYGKEKINNSIVLNDNDKKIQLILLLVVSGVLAVVQ